MKRVLSFVLLLCALLMLLALAGCKKEESPDPDKGPNPSGAPASVGLEMTLSKDGTYYTVTGLGSCRDKVVVIPATYMFRPVRAIAAGAFSPKGGASESGLSPLNTTAPSPEEQIAQVIIPDSVTDVGDEAFKGCTDLEKIELSNLISMIGTDAFKDTAFYQNENNWQDGALYLDVYLVNVRETVSGTFTVREDTKHIADGALKSCTAITEVVLPDSVRVVGKQSFQNCSALAKINLDIAGLYISDEAFSGCCALRTVSVGNNVAPTAPAEDNELPTFSTVEDLGDDVIVWGAGTAHFHHYKASAYYGNDDFVFSTVIGDRAFADCTSLQEITFGTNVRFVGKAAFSGCTALTAVDLSNITATTAKDPILTPFGVTYTETDLCDAFENCTALSSVIFPQNITLLHGTFRGCTALKTIAMPDTVRKARDTFINCTALTAVTLSKGLTHIGGLFYGCTALETVALPDFLTIVAPDTFRGCTALATLTLPDNVRRVWENAFLECSAEAIVSIGKNITYIGNCAFAYLPELQFRGTAAEWNAINLDPGFAGDLYTVVHCTDSDVTYGKLPE